MTIRITAACVLISRPLIPLLARVALQADVVVFVAFLPQSARSVLALPLPSASSVPAWPLGGGLGVSRYPGAAL